MRDARDCRWAWRVAGVRERSQRRGEDKERTNPRPRYYASGLTLSRRRYDGCLTTTEIARASMACYLLSKESRHQNRGIWAAGNAPNVTAVVVQALRSTERREMDEFLQERVSQSVYAFIKSRLGTPEQPQNVDACIPRHRNEWIWQFRHLNRWIWWLQASESIDFEAPGINIDGFGRSRHQHRWIWRLQA